MRSFVTRTVKYRGEFQEFCLRQTGLASRSPLTRREGPSSPGIPPNNGLAPTTVCSAISTQTVEEIPPPYPTPSFCEGEWPGLSVWRNSDLNDKRGWGANGPCSDVPAPSAGDFEFSLPSTLAECGLLVLKTANPREKAAITHKAWTEYRNGNLNEIGSARSIVRPARPPKPQLVPPREVPNMKNTPLPKVVTMLHNLAHIELNAIDLAWDTLVRFSSLGLEESFYVDFTHVADDESRHFGWCIQRLLELGHDYGDMVAHDMLWQSAQQSDFDVNARLALVPMSQEARGLDAGPRLAKRIEQMGDTRSASVVWKIAEEEKAHVAVGVSWFLRVNKLMGVDPGQVYKSWLSNLSPELLHEPFNHEAREEVGMQREWYDKSKWANGNMLDATELEALRGRLYEVLDVEVANSINN